MARKFLFFIVYLIVWLVLASRLLNSLTRVQNSTRIGEFKKIRDNSWQFAEKNFYFKLLNSWTIRAIRQKFVTAFWRILIVGINTERGNGLICLFLGHILYDQLSRTSLASTCLASVPGVTHPLKQPAILHQFRIGTWQYCECWKRLLKDAVTSHDGIIEP